MRLALKTHRVVLVGVVQLVAAVIASAFGDTRLALPGLGGDGPLSLLVALMATLTTAPALVRAWPTERMNVARNAGLISIAMLCLQLAPAGVTAAIFAVSGSSHGIVYVGILLWLLALQLSTGVLVSATYQGIAPAVYVFLCALIGRIDSAVQPWAWPLADPGVLAAIVVGGGAFGVALGLLAWLGLHRDTSR
ncbi:hypothetical protein [Microbacterium radiodurans]|uniref:Uncharacterized protein n=1 Tax=Microbacterium radiodurans TaxID=661398 RepID=A0A5J5ITT4_9MICO|nr:hypothetical protein [Microbacterium radiodurans]KAA9085429.1 hypothetical protein F6B42_13280 [Microbacterium radiodurans]